MENDYEKYAEELKKENENLRQNLKNVEEERDYFRLMAQKYVAKYVEGTKEDEKISIVNGVNDILERI